jgi:hypothetical protein
MDSTVMGGGDRDVLAKDGVDAVSKDDNSRIPLIFG